MLGMLYRNGQGVSADAQKALDWLHKAAAGGHARAREVLARMNADLEKHSDLHRGNFTEWLVKIEEGRVSAAPQEGLGLKARMLSLSAPDAKVLLDNFADPNARDEDGATPLMHAAANTGDGAEIVRMLLLAGAKPRLLDNSGKRALDYARDSGNFFVIEMLKKP